MFMFFEPLEGKRHVVVTDQRTAVDWAHKFATWLMSSIRALNALHWLWII